MGTEEAGRLKRRFLITVMATALLSVVPVASPASAAEGATCTRPESNAEALETTYTYAGWQSATDSGDTSISIYIKGHPSMTAEELGLIRGAIGTWNTVLQQCLDGAVRLALTGSMREADVVLRFIPRWGGSVYGGVATCHMSPCQVFVRNEFTTDVYTPGEFTDIVLHELGHILGLAHATNLEESNDLMGYGWIGEERGVLSQCDVDALASIWSWAIDGTEARPAEGTFTC